MGHTIVGSLFIIIILGAGWLLVFYSNMVNRKTVVEDAWGLLYRQIQKRNEVLKGYIETYSDSTGTEGQYLKQIIAANTCCPENDSPYAVLSIAGGISKYIDGLVGSEADGGPAGNQLQRELAELEQRVERYRESYREKVHNYNGFLSRFPNNVAGQILGVQQFTEID